MSAPEYSTSDLEKVSGKLMSNSALVAVKRTGLDTVNDSDIVENLEVIAEMHYLKEQSVIMHSMI